MEKALKKAIEGGWIPNTIKPIPCTITRYENLDQIEFRYNKYTTMYKSYADVCFDPTFWQCLGRACGWDLVEGESLSKDLDVGGTIYLQGWIRNWHALIDHLADGRNVEEFMNNLIK